MKIPKNSILTALLIGAGLLSLSKVSAQNEMPENFYFDKKRSEQNKFWLLSTIEQQLKTNFYQNLRVKDALQKEIDNLENGKTTPFNAAKRLLDL